MIEFFIFLAVYLISIPLPARYIWREEIKTLKETKRYRDWCGVWSKATKWNYVWTWFTGAGISLAPIGNTVVSVVLVLVWTYETIYNSKLGHWLRSDL